MIFLPTCCASLSSQAEVQRRALCSLKNEAFFEPVAAKILRRRAIFFDKNVFTLICRFVWELKSKNRFHFYLVRNAFSWSEMLHSLGHLDEAHNLIVTLKSICTTSLSICS